MIVAVIPYKFWRKKIVLTAMGLGSLGLLTAAFLFGKVINGAKGWILGIQPAEFVKIAVIITLASFFAKKQERQTPFFQGIIPPIFVVGGSMVLILLQNDLGTDILIGGTVLIMFFCSGVNVNLWIKDFY